jgi:hypothetical protein
VRAERDELISEVASLKAKVELLERREDDRARSETAWYTDQDKSLAGAANAIRSRDAVIDDLAARLERALDTIVIEREQQRHRRQIIFPTQRPAPTAEEEAELEITKTALRETQSELDTLRKEQEKERLASMLRIEKLERQLEASRSR